ncbi:MAG: hypothetical protein H6811_01590 [Phycisphaeraceae bacterium]|nr:hypothetical protein [Phycisphaeraceae bacterium]
MRRAAEGAVQRTAGRVLIAPLAEGWISAYPTEELVEPKWTGWIAEAADVQDAILFTVHDSDVLCYWYFREGKLADQFNSCPDYYGEAEEEELAAIGNPNSFSGLLDAMQRERLRELLNSRMVDGEYTGDGPEFDVEDDRLAEIAQLLGIPGALGSYDYLMAGESIEGGLPREEMIEVSSM